MKRVSSALFFLHIIILTFECQAEGIDLVASSIKILFIILLSLNIKFKSLKEELSTIDV